MSTDFNFNYNNNNSNNKNKNIEYPRHIIQYEIQFKNPVDYFDVVLQKQIDFRKKFDIDENSFRLILSYKDDRFLESNFLKKYSKFFNNVNFIRYSFIEINNSPNKYDYFKKIYTKTFSMINGYSSYTEFEYEFDLALEEFKLFLDKFEFNEEEKKIINSFILDENIKQNIEFIGWNDFWTE